MCLQVQKILDQKFSKSHIKNFCQEKYQHMPLKLSIIHYVSEFQEQVTYSIVEKEKIPNTKNYSTTKIR